MPKPLTHYKRSAIEVVEVRNRHHGPSPLYDEFYDFLHWSDVDVLVPLAEHGHSWKGIVSKEDADKIETWCKENGYEFHG